jgi:pimeloyl-ACP methyl ester carboxylesterase
VLRTAGNYYRNRRQNFQDEQALLAEGPRAVAIQCPILFVRSLKDVVITSDMIPLNETLIPYHTQKDVDAGHWILWQKPEEVNKILEE